MCHLHSSLYCISVLVIFNLILLIIVCNLLCFVSFVFFFKQKTAYEMRISDWSSDVCSSDLFQHLRLAETGGEDQVCQQIALGGRRRTQPHEIGRASCRERVCQYV